MAPPQQGPGHIGDFCRPSYLVPSKCSVRRGSTHSSSSSSSSSWSCRSELQSVYVLALPSQD
ncbi:unnamed protein product, partial [Ectocarpus sp. 13 AM-2016]